MVGMPHIRRVQSRGQRLLFPIALGIAIAALILTKSPWVVGYIVLSTVGIPSALVIVMRFRLRYRTRHPLPRELDGIHPRILRPSPFRRQVEISCFGVAAIIALGVALRPHQTAGESFGTLFSLVSALIFSGIMYMHNTLYIRFFEDEMWIKWRIRKRVIVGRTIEGVEWQRSKWGRVEYLNIMVIDDSPVLAKMFRQGRISAAGTRHVAERCGQEVQSLALRCHET
jgi:hypothetical protein